MPIIKCPGCGQNTSSMALTCPHCSAQIRGHIHRCPACDTWSFCQDEVCPTCGATISEAIGKATDQSATTGQASQEPPHRPLHKFTRPCPIVPPKNRGKKHGRGCLSAFATMCLILLFLAGTAYGIYRYDLARQARQEAARQELALRIAEDEKANDKKLRQAQQDSIFWNHTLKLKTIEAARQYIAEYPEGIFINEAYMLMEELQRRTVSQSEQTHIMGVVDNSFAAAREQQIKNGARRIRDIQFRIPDSLVIRKKQITPDSLLYFVSGKVNKITIPAGKARPDTATIELHMTLDKHKNIIESNLASKARR